MGMDHAHQNIRINAVCPNEVNTMRTGFEIRGLDPDYAISDLRVRLFPWANCRTEDIADVVMFLASDDARYMPGALVEVNELKTGHMMRFKDKTVLVTGGRSGIGKATAQRFADEGAEFFTAQQGCSALTLSTLLLIFLTLMLHNE